MGFVKHWAIVVTSWDRDRLEALRDRAALMIQLPVSSLVLSPCNGYWTFLVASGGSKRRWPEDARNEAQRAEFIDWLRLARNEDDSSSIEWVEVGYGMDPHNASLGRHEWDGAPLPTPPEPES